MEIAASASFANPRNLRGLLCLGVVNEGASEQECFFAWGLLIQDEEVKKRAYALPPREGTVISVDAYRTAMEQMTPTERKELRGRVIARLGRKAAAQQP